MLLGVNPGGLGSLPRILGREMGLRVFFLFMLTCVAKSGDGTAVGGGDVCG